MSRSRSLILLLVIAGLVAGCAPQPVEEIKRPTPLKASDLKPTTRVQKVFLSGDPRPDDSDNDGRPDVINVTCYLFPERIPGAISVVGKGSFRFEIYRTDRPSEDREPLVQLNVPYEESLKHLWVTTMPMYAFRLSLPPLPSDVRAIFIRARFFPEGGDEADPGGVTAVVPRFGPTVTTTPSRSPNETVETRIIRLTPRKPTSQPEDGGK